MIREANESQCSGNSKAPPIFTDSCDVKMYENLSEKNLDIKEHTIEPKDFFSSPVLMHFKKVAEQRHIQLSNSCYEFNPYRFIKCLPPYEQVKSSCEQGNLLPEKQSDRKATLVLDLDETLVHCTIDPIPNPDYAFDVVCNQQTFSVYALKRPGLDDFLNARLFVSKLFEVVVFTASQRVYAEALLNMIDPHRKLIPHRLFREACLEVQGNYLKDLNVLGRDLKRVILVDNSPYAYGYQISNGIPIESWFDDKNDRELEALLPLLKRLGAEDDVRPLIETIYKTKELVEKASAYDLV